MKIERHGGKSVSCKSVSGKHLPRLVFIFHLYMYQHINR